MGALLAAQVIERRAVYPIPVDENERIAIVQELALDDHADLPAFDAICRRAARDFGIPIAGLSLVDRDVVHFLGRRGMPFATMPRAESFCSHVLVADEPVVVEDMRLDPRFADSPYVTGPHGLRFYAGAPVRYGDGVRIGTLCVVDHAPRRFGAAERGHLTRLADRAAREIWLQAATARKGCFLVD